ncbi:MAG TPA: hypothetical protein VF789_12865 [Thermoanaerobaculia bacterium]
MAGQTFGDLIEKWDQLARAVEVNALPLLQEERAQLQTVVANARELSKRQDAERAIKQQTSQDLKAALLSGRDLSNRLRIGVRAVLGPKNEKLVEYGIPPQRPQKRTRKVGETKTPASKDAKQDAGVTSAAE